MFEPQGSVAVFAAIPAEVEHLAVAGAVQRLGQLVANQDCVAAGKRSFG